MTVSYIIVSRNPRNKKLMIICNDDDAAYSPAEFDTEEKAYEAAMKTALCRSWGAEIVPVNPPNGA